VLTNRNGDTLISLGQDNVVEGGEVDVGVVVQNNVVVYSVRIRRLLLEVEPEHFDDPGVQVSTSTKKVVVLLESKEGLICVRVVVEDAVNTTDDESNGDRVWDEGGELGVLEIGAGLAIQTDNLKEVVGGPIAVSVNKSFYG
jgi:hypothetical protein